MPNGTSSTGTASDWEAEWAGTRSYLRPGSGTMDSNKSPLCGKLSVFWTAGYKRRPWHGS